MSLTGVGGSESAYGALAGKKRHAQACGLVWYRALDKQGDAALAFRGEGMTLLACAWVKA